MNIVVASDENYVPHLETLLVSIGINNENVDSLTIYIFDSGISEESKRTISELSVIYTNMKISFLEMSSDTIAAQLGGNPSKDRSLAAYARIFIPEIIGAERALYLDVDAIVMQDLSELYNTDLSGFAIAGVADTNPITRHRNVGLDDNEIYINSGMILWNLEKCREIGFVDRCKEFVMSRDGKVDAMDQGTINGVLSKMGLIKKLHPKFNVLTSMFQLKNKEILKFYRLLEYYSDDLLREATNSPVFVHFTPNMSTRPWVKHCTHPLREEYWKYRANTSHKKKQLQNDSRSLKMRLLGWMYRNLPKSVFMFLLKLKRK
ncbi:MAG: glycosyltransferase family 8 protein [Clostridia bacterium]|nr:glycosyltransferase family 8 protein [Clostridia bacterium]